MNNYDIATAIVKVESTDSEILELMGRRESELVQAYQLVAGIHKTKGKVAQVAEELRKIKGLKSAPKNHVKAYSVGGYLWVNDLDPQATAEELRTAVNATYKALGVAKLEELAERALTVAEFIELSKRALSAKPETVAEESEESEESSEDTTPKNSLLDVVLSHLPHLTAEELATVAGAVAELSATKATELTNA